MEQQLEALGLLVGEVRFVHRAVLQPLGAAAVHTREVVLITIQGREQGLTAGQMTAADQAPLLQLAQVAVDRGQTHGLGPLAQPGMQLLAGEFPLGLLQLIQQ